MAMEIEERFLAVLTDIAKSLSRMADVYVSQHQQKVSDRPQVRDIDLNYVKSEEEQRRENLGSTGEETTIDWTSIGRRERKFLEDEQRRSTTEKQSR